MAGCRVDDSGGTQFPTSMRRPIGCAKLEGNHYYRDEWLQSSLSIDDVEAIAVNCGQHGFGSRHEICVTGSPTVPGRVTGPEVTPGTGQACCVESPPTDGRRLLTTSSSTDEFRAQRGPKLLTEAELETTFTGNRFDELDQLSLQVGLNAAGRGGFSDVSAGTPNHHQDSWHRQSAALWQEVEGEEIGEATAPDQPGRHDRWKFSRRRCTVKKGKVVKVEGRDLQTYRERPATVVALPMPATAFSRKGQNESSDRTTRATNPNGRKCLDNALGESRCHHDERRRYGAGVRLLL